MSSRICCTGLDVKHIHKPDGEFLDFRISDQSLQSQTVYNPSVPFDDGGRTIILGREEAFNDEASSRIVIYDYHTLLPLQSTPILNHHQDPYFCGIFEKGSRVFGAVKISTDPLTNEITNWQDHLYTYSGKILGNSSGSSLRLLAAGPPKQKDTRIVQMPGRVAVLTRPQGVFGGAGSFAYFETQNLDTLQTDWLNFYSEADESTFIHGILDEGEWGGPNQLIPIDTNHMYVVGHKAWRTSGYDMATSYRHYKGIGFVFNTKTHKIQGEIKTLAEATHFEPVTPKFEDLGHVVFTSGLGPVDEHGKRPLIAGIGDVKVGRRYIDDPLKSYYATV